MAFVANFLKSTLYKNSIYNYNDAFLVSYYNSPNEKIIIWKLLSQKEDD